MDVRKDVCDSQEAVKLMKKFNLKRLVVGRGHDCGGLIADLCIGSRVIATYHDDGWGGEPEVRFTSDADESKAKDILTKGNFAQLMFDNGWDFMGKVIDFDTQINCLVEGLANLKNVDKIMRSTKNKLVFGNQFSYRSIYWKGLKNLKDLPTHQLQGAYDRCKKELKGGKFFNTDEQLLSLGIKL